jgi:uncharacterized small protein (TIGR04563 family)
MPRKRKKSAGNDVNNNSSGNPHLQVSQGERQSIYFPKDMAEEIKAEALRQDRSISWIIQKAWRISRQKMKQLPGANELEAEFSPPRKKK